jgi:hypothetical protein
MSKNNDVKIVFGKYKIKYHTTGTSILHDLTKERFESSKPKP